MKKIIAKRESKVKGKQLKEQRDESADMRVMAGVIMK